MKKSSALFTYHTDFTWKLLICVNEIRIVKNLFREHRQDIG